MSRLPNLSDAVKHSPDLPKIKLNSASSDTYNKVTPPSPRRPNIRNNTAPVQNFARLSSVFSDGLGLRSPLSSWFTGKSRGDLASPNQTDDTAAGDTADSNDLKMYFGDTLMGDSKANKRNPTRRYSVNQPLSSTPLLLRCNSLPDLRKIGNDTMQQELNESFNEYTIPNGKLQIDILSANVYTKVKRSYVRVKLGGQVYKSAELNSPTGNWNEGFRFNVSFNSQLFDRIYLDLYDVRKWGSNKRIGRAHVNIALLRNRPFVFLTYLPIYPYSQNYLPRHASSPNLYETNRPNNTERISTDTLLVVEDRPETATLPRSNTLLGYFYVRVYYKYQFIDSDPVQTTGPILFGSTLVDEPEEYNEDSQDTLNSSQSGDKEETTSSSSSNPRPIAKQDSFISIEFSKRLHEVLFQGTPKKIPTTVKAHKSKRKPLPFELDNIRDLPRRSSRSHGFNKIENGDSGTVSLKEAFVDPTFGAEWVNETFNADEVYGYASIDKVAGLMLSDGTRKVLRAVIALVRQFGQGFKIPALKLIPTISVLERFYAQAPKQYMEDQISDLALIETAMHYFLFAMIAYGWRVIYLLGSTESDMFQHIAKLRSNTDAITNFLKIPSEDLLGYEFGIRKGAVFHPSYYVARDRANNAIVLAIRGTMGMYDIISDVVCDYKPWRGGLAHSGILASAQWFFIHVVPHIFNYIHTHPEEITSLVVTGHSLGAGVASLVTMMLVEHLDELKKLSGNPEFRLQCYAYAPVAATSMNLAEKYKNHIQAFIYEDDIVGRMSYGSMSDLKQMIMGTLQIVNDIGGASKMKAGSEGEKDCFKLMQILRESIYNEQTPNPRLYIPSTVYHLRRLDAEKSASDPTRRKTVFMERSTPKISEEVIFTHKCIKHHLLGDYVKAFRRSREWAMLDGLSDSEKEEIIASSERSNSIRPMQSAQENATEVSGSGEDKVGGVKGNKVPL